MASASVTGHGLLAVQPEVNTMRRPWSSGMAGGICDDPGVCCCGLCCAPCLFGRNFAEHYDTGCCGACCLYTWCSCLACYFASDLRTSIRHKYNLKPEPCSDFCAHLWCSPCALCQETREMRFHGQLPPREQAYQIADSR